MIYYVVHFCCIYATAGPAEGEAGDADTAANMNANAAAAAGASAKPPKQTSAMAGLLARYVIQYVKLYYWCCSHYMRSMLLYCGLASEG